MPLNPITDSEVLLLAGIAGTLKADYETKTADPWIESPFGWIKSRPSRQVGAIGEQLVAGWCAAKGLDVVRSRNSDADRIIHGQRLEIKFSTLWASGGYKFQQIRNQEYDYLFCLGVSPFDAHGWVFPKSVLLERVIGHMGQHTGSGGTDTAWLGFDVRRPYDWMAPYGGSLSEAFTVLSKMPRGDH